LPAVTLQILLSQNVLTCVEITTANKYDFFSYVRSARILRVLKRWQVVNFV